MNETVNEPATKPRSLEQILVQIGEGIMGIPPEDATAGEIGTVDRILPPKESVYQRAVEEFGKRNYGTSAELFGFLAEYPEKYKLEEALSYIILINLMKNTRTALQDAAKLRARMAELPTTRTVQYNLGLYHFIRSALHPTTEYEEALYHFVNAQALADDDGNIMDSDVYRMKGIVYRKLGNFKEAEKFLRYASLKNPANTEILKDLAVTFQLQKKMDKAREIANKAIKRDENLAPYFFRQGIVGK